MAENIEDLSDLYQPFTPEAAEADEKRLPTYSTMKLGVGKKVIRILPPPPGFVHATPWLLVHEHWIDLPGGKVGFPCLVQHCGERCPGCIKAEQLRKSGSKADRDVAERMAAKPTAFCHVIERGNEDAGVQTLRLPQSVLRDLLKHRNDSVTCGDDFTNPLHGFDVQIVGTKKGEYTNYETNIARRPTPMVADTSKIREMLTTRPDLMEKLRLRTWQEIVEDVQKKSAAGGQGGQQAMQSSSQQNSVAGAIEATATGDDMFAGGADEDIPF